jgi:hypothetical protein
MEDSTPTVQGDESTMRKKKKILRPTIVPQRWPGESTLATVRQLNTRWITLLAKQPHDDAALADLWEQMDSRACDRAGRCPVLLVELNLQNSDSWHRASQRSGDLLLPESTSAPNNECEVSLVREILMDARTIGRTMPRALNLIFGLASPVAETIIQMGIPQIDRVAAEEGRKLKPRWSESRSFWKALLRASIGADDQVLANVHLHCLQLLGSEVVLH